MNRIVTPEVIEKVKNYLTNEKYAGLTFDEIGAMSGVSGTTVGRIKNGVYDKQQTAEQSESVSDKLDEVISLLKEIIEMWRND